MMECLQTSKYIETVYSLNPLSDSEDYTVTDIFKEYIYIFCTCGILVPKPDPLPNAMLEMGLGSPATQ